jgi:hypothetical protein
MKPQFHEDFISKHADPLVPKHSDFPYEEVFRDLDGELEPDWQDDDLNAKLAQALKAVFQWVLDTNNDNSNSIIKENSRARLKLSELVGRRFLALAWVVNPDLFPDGPSLTSLAKTARTSKWAMRRLTGQVSREFGITNRGQAHAWNRSPKAKALAHSKAIANNQRTVKVSTPLEPAQSLLNEKESFKSDTSGQVSAHSYAPVTEGKIDRSHESRTATAAPSPV